MATKRIYRRFKKSRKSNKKKRGGGPTPEEIAAAAEKAEAEEDLVAGGGGAGAGGAAAVEQAVTAETIKNKVDALFTEIGESKNITPQQGSRQFLEIVLPLVKMMDNETLRTDIIEMLHQSIQK